MLNRCKIRRFIDVKKAATRQIWYQCKQEPDGCIVWNAHNTVFGSKGSVIYALAVYFLHSTMPSVTCLRLSDVSVICSVTYLYFAIQACFSFTLVNQGHSGVLGLSNIGHRTLQKIWGGFLYGAYRPGELIQW